MKKSVLILFDIIIFVFSASAQTGSLSFGLPLESYHVTQGFGENINPIDGRTFFHPGIDISNYRSGDPVAASLAGTVTETGFDRVYGNFIRIRHANNYETFYGQLSEISVLQGQSVAKGEKIGLVGNTGLSTGPHLHFGMYRNGDAIDPRTVLQF